MDAIAARLMGTMFTEAVKQIFWSMFRCGDSSYLSPNTANPALHTIHILYMYLLHGELRPAT